MALLERIRDNDGRLSPGIEINPRPVWESLLNTGTGMHDAHFCGPLSSWATRYCAMFAETSSQIDRYPALLRPTADSADAVGYGEGMGCFAAMQTWTVA
jgi:hypothetical protein